MIDEAFSESLQTWRDQGGIVVAMPTFVVAMPTIVETCQFVHESILIQAPASYRWVFIAASRLTKSIQNCTVSYPFALVSGSGNGNHGHLYRITEQVAGISECTNEFDHVACCVFLFSSAIL